MLFLVALLATSDTGSYWQQQVAYRITASLDEPSGVLTGHERITYVNRSPDVLHDFYVHDYLNAFRPGSRWAAVDSAEGRVRFQHLRDPEYAFERLTAATVMGETLRPDGLAEPGVPVERSDLKALEHQLRQSIDLVYHPWTRALTLFAAPNPQR